jgi:hypothetical protein
MFNSILRKFATCLSFYYKNRLHIKKNYEINIINRINIYKKKNTERKKILETHNIFNQNLEKLIADKNFRNFLRESFIQKIFFVHNRIYILFMLLYILFKNKIYFRKLIAEDNIGNPVRFFLYPKSSGNRIREVFHLVRFQEFSNLSLEKLDLIFEFGGGYGNMARLFNKINKNLTYIIQDTLNVSLIQYYYLSMLKIPVTFKKYSKNKLSLNINLNNVNLKKNHKKKLFIANWSLSESPLKTRNAIINKMTQFDYLLISFQNKFEDIDNYKFFNKILPLFKNNFSYKISEIPFMNIFTLSNKHYYLFIKND